MLLVSLDCSSRSVMSAGGLLRHALVLPWRGFEGCTLRRMALSNDER
jgi:hypothetical protein